MISEEYANGDVQGMSRGDAIKEMVFHPAWSVVVEEISELVTGMRGGLDATVRDFDKDISEIRYMAGQADGARKILEHLLEWEEYASKPKE